MFIRCERLFLRPGWPEDWAEVFAGIADEGVVRNLARAPWPYRAEDAQSFLARWRDDTRWPTFLIVLPPDGAVIGCIGLHPDDDGRTELGYWLARAQWGRGYAPEAARAVLSLACTLGHRQVFAGHFVDNPASERVLVKAGFRPTGRTAPRACVARGHEVESVEYAVELAPACNRDGCDAEIAMQAA